MLKNLSSLIRFFIFWLLFFAITRLAFELYFSSKLKEASAVEVFLTFYYGLRLDASATAYICSIPLLIFIINWWIPKTQIKSLWLRVYLWFCLLCICLNTALNFNIYREWGTKVVFRIFTSLYNSPLEALASTGSSPIGRCFIICLLLFALGVFLSAKIIDYQFKKPKIGLGLKAVISMLLLFLNFVLLRGGLQPEPVNQNSAYFSDKEFLNQASLNTEWNLFNNIVENLQRPHNPFLFLQAKKAEQLVQELYTVKKDSTIKVLTTDHPNVVIIQLESFTADLIQSLNGEKGVTPNFENFINDGILFTNIYAAGDRTDKGIVSIMSGFPSQGIRTIITNTNKQKKLPALSATLKAEGYATSYFYGGKSGYMNFDDFMKSHQVETILDESAFDKTLVKTNWGVYDDVLFSKQLQFVNKLKQPFFSYLQTSTNHEPFVLPVKGHYPDDDGQGDASNKFRSTAWFTDSCLNAYFEQAKKTGWYKNTLFILVADHGHRLPRNTSEAFNPKKYHIPLLFFGDVIKPAYRGKKITKLGGQTDIAATLLAQLGLPVTKFNWSKNLLNPYTTDFAFFNWDNGFGFLTPGQSVSFDNSGRRIVYVSNKNASKESTENVLLHGKAYLQKVFTHYLDY